MTPKEQWLALKARGNPTHAEIEAIDKATPWSIVEPEWWLEMMDAQRLIVTPAPAKTPKPEPHTPGILRAEGQHLFSDSMPKRTWGTFGQYSGPYIVGQLGLYSSPDSTTTAANARRLAAAWNICHGLPTEFIERNVSIDLAHTDHISQLEQEVARLCKALQDAKAKLDAAENSYTHSDAKPFLVAEASTIIEEALHPRKEGDCTQCGGDCPEHCCQVYMSGFGSRPVK